MTTPIILVHGGAGNWSGNHDRLQDGIQACIRAAEVGQEALMAGKSALDAVELATRVLEDAPSLDAGLGSYPNRDGIIEVDAVIMDGKTLDLGAVMALPEVQNPITLARRVMTDTPHAYLAGEGASRFADSIHFPRVSNEILFTPFAEPDQSGALGDTVGAVAIDQEGNLAVATSTGGTKNKMPGRVGDSPIVGCGAYADNLGGAISATGHGESILKLVPCLRISDSIEKGQSAQEACDAAVAHFIERIGPEGQVGFIALDHRGGIGIAFNTHAMPFAHASGSGEIVFGS